MPKALHGNDAKRWQNIGTERLHIDLERFDGFPIELSMALVSLFSHQGLNREDPSLQYLMNEPIFHETARTRMQLTKYITFPTNNESEESITPFMVYLLALMVGKQRHVHVHATPVTPDSIVKANIAICRVNDDVVLNITSTWLGEDKKSTEIGTDRSNVQSAAKQCRNLHYGFEILVCEKEVQFLAYDHALDWLFKSGKYDLYMRDEDAPSPGLQALSVFLSTATVKSLAQFALSTLDGRPIPVDLTDAEILALTRTSLVLGLPDDNTVLKRVNDPSAFQNELKALRALTESRDNVVRLDAFDEENLWMQLSPQGLKGDLASWLRQSRDRLPFENMLGMFQGLLEGLCHLHKSGIIHRDIRPENIICIPGRLVLIDLGVAVVVGNKAEWRSQHFEGFPKLAADTHMDELLKQRSFRMLVWTPTTDLESLAKVALYAFSQNIQFAVDSKFEAYMFPDELHLSESQIEVRTKFRDFWRKAIASSEVLHLPNQEDQAKNIVLSYLKTKSEQLYLL